MAAGLGFTVALAIAANPIVPGVGMADPHIHAWTHDPSRVFGYMTHDCSKSGNDPCVLEQGELGFRMTSWWVWSSTDLVTWHEESRVTPSQISWEDANTSQECWATDAASFANGSTFFYLSVGPKQIGVVTGSSPAGPFHDPLGKPLVPEGLVPTYSRDPGVLMDVDGVSYLIWGTFSYYIARLNPDMISFAEPPRGVKILQQQHRDDKPFLHRRGKLYYLSWGCFYAVGGSPYGPFNYSGSVIDPATLINTSFASGGGTQDRHGSFFTFKNQTYFACNDRSHGGGSGFRSTIIAYVHYRTNGTIAPIRIDETGVGQYNVTAQSTIEAEDYFELTGLAIKKQAAGEDNRFVVAGITDGCALEYPRLTGLGRGMLVLSIANGGTQPGTVTVKRNGTTVATCAVASTGGWNSFVQVPCGTVGAGLSSLDSWLLNLRLEFSGPTVEFANLDNFTINP